jgi:hypothetical protein
VGVGFLTLAMAAAASAQTTATLHVVASLGGYVTATGIDCGDGGRTDCDESYATPTAISLEAVPSPGYDFLAWTDDCSGDTPAINLLVDQAIGCHAVFDPSPSSGAPGDPAHAAAALFVDRIDNTSLHRREISIGPDSGLRVSTGIQLGWVQVTRGDFSVTFSAASGSVVPGDYPEAYRTSNPLFPSMSIAGCAVTVGRFHIDQVTRIAGMILNFAADFEGRCSEASDQAWIVGSVRFNSTRTTILPFDGIYPLIKVTIEPTVNGFVSGNGIDCGPGRDHCSETFEAARSVTLVATPSPGYRFVGWSGSCDGGRSTTTIMVDRIQRCSGIFNAVIPGLGLEDPRIGSAAFTIETRAANQTAPPQRHIWLDVVISALGDPGVQVHPYLPDGTTWEVSLYPPQGQALQTGMSYQVNSGSDSPTIYVNAPEGQCSAVAGRFVVYEISRVYGSGVGSLAADFTCEAQDGSSITGSIRLESGRSILTPFAPTTFTPVPEPRRPDVNRDGSPDLIWRHSLWGYNAAWLLNGVNASSTTLLAPSDAALVSDLNWEIRAVGDMNGDGNPDLIWQNSVTGRMAVWFFSGVTLLGTNYVYTAAGDTDVEPDLDWKIVAAGDMDRDGSTDLLWRHRTSGAMRVWHMTGNVQWDSVPFYTVSDTAWEIAGLADINGDGLLDLVWRHYGTGVLATWFMYDTLVQATLWLSPREVPDMNWRIVGVADLNADTHPDLVWQNVVTGELTVWFMNGITAISGRYLNPSRVPDPNWRVVGVK